MQVFPHLNRRLQIGLHPQPEEEWRQFCYRLQLLPLVRLILHNDEYNDSSFVVEALMYSVVNLTRKKAWDIMMAAHMHGHAQVIVCPQETAELYQDRLSGLGLTSSIEQV
jgi:ATP-dependent Clp protease adapter protein ClpS